MATTRMRSERLEVRTTNDERALIDRAVAEQGTDLTEFVIANLTVAARRVLADRTEFVLDAESVEAWDVVNSRRAPVTSRACVGSWSARRRSIRSDSYLSAARAASGGARRWRVRVPVRRTDRVASPPRSPVLDHRNDARAGRHASQLGRRGRLLRLVHGQHHPPEAPARARKGAGRFPQPVALLARLGVDVRREGRGVGAGLLQDVIPRTRALGEEIGCRGLLVPAETSEARDFYLHLVPEFEASPTDELHLLLLMKDIRRTLS